MSSEKPEQETGACGGCGAGAVPFREAKSRKAQVSFFSGVLALGGGAAVAQALGLITMPIFSRMFPPEAFGLLAVFTSFYTIVGSISGARYEWAVMLPEKDEDAANIFGANVLAVAAVSALSAALLAFFHRPLLAVLKTPDLFPVLWLLPVSVLLFGLALPLRFWCNRHNQYKQLALARILITVTNILAVLVGGLLGFLAGTDLIVCRTLSLAAAPGILLWYLWRRDLAFILRSLHPGQMWRQAKRYKRFPLFSSWETFLDTASREAPTLLLTVFFGSTVTGFYNRGFLLVAFPIGLVGEAVSRVLLQRTAEKRAGGEDMSVLCKGVFERLLKISILPFALLAIIGPDLFSVVLGQEWREAGVYAQILSFWLFFMFLFSPLSVLFCVLERQGTSLIFNALLFTLLVAVLLVGGGWIGNVHATLLVFSLVSGILYFAASLYLLKLVGVPCSWVLKHVGRAVLAVSPALFITGLCEWWLALSFGWIVLTMLVLSAPYAYLLVRNDEQLRQGLRAVFRKPVG